MQTEKFGIWTVVRHADFSGDVTIYGPNETKVEVPFKILVSLVAAWARDTKLAALEGATDREVLGLPPTTIRR